MIEPAIFSSLREDTNPDVDKERKSYGPSASVFISLKFKGMVSNKLKISKFFIRGLSSCWVSVTRHKRHSRLVSR